jgi:glycosyltransferase involved in cell wall biosynthesis
MEVLFLTSWYPTVDHPYAGVFVREHARAAGLHHDVRVIHLRGKDAALDSGWRLEREEDAAMTLGIPTWRLRHAPGRVPLVSNLRRYLRSADAAVTLMVEEGFRPAIIHASIYEAGMSAVRIGRRLRVPVVVSEHSSDFPRRRLPPWQVMKARYAFEHAAHVLVATQAVRDGIEGYGIRAAFATLRNVADSVDFHPDTREREAGPPRLLFVGSLIPVKGVTVLLRSLAQLDGMVRLELVGEGCDRTTLESLSAELGLADRVSFRGRLSKAQLAEEMRRADLFVLPSLWDNAPCVISEAMASGLPIVSTSTGGIPEMVGLDAGWLAPPGDPESLASALRRGLDVLPNWDRPAQARRAEVYSLQSVGDRLDELYRELAAA